MEVTPMHHAPGPGRSPGPALIGAFESTYLPGHGLDVVETTGHDRLWRDDLEWVVRGGSRLDVDPREPSASVPSGSADLVVLSHLRWSWVWQRPQHLVSRFAAMRSRTGARTWFVEEPVTEDVAAPGLRWEEVEGITRVWLVLPPDDGHTGGFGAAGAKDYGDLLADLLTSQGRPPAPDVLIYTPLAHETAQRLGPGRVAYDVMDDLASFAAAPEGLRLAQRRLLGEADVVFAGGRSLHRSVSQLHKRPCHLFPSGVETAHYASSRLLRRRRGPKVAGYVGVLDERLDLGLLRGLAEAMPDWTVRIVGPVAKIEPSSLPRLPNLEYPGQAAYEDLPEVMAGFDVALMPFALNEATRSISPTKTLEYLAAGLPVVSTRVEDVVADYTGVVHFADDASGFAAACRAVVKHSGQDRDVKLRPLQAAREWDAIAQEMAELLSGHERVDARPEVAASGTSA